MSGDVFAKPNLGSALAVALGVLLVTAMLIIQKKARWCRREKVNKTDLFCFVLYYLLPIIGTILYASSTKWSKSLLPSDFTLQWFQQLLTDREFIAAVGRSLY